jgi:hypothetical protein
LGNGEGKIRPAPARRIAKRHQEESPKNLNNYRLTEADRLGEGGPKQKFQQNLKAIQTLRMLDAEERPATEKEKAALVKYVGWGAMPQVFDVDSTDWPRSKSSFLKFCPMKTPFRPRHHPERSLHRAHRHRRDVSRRRAVRFQRRSRA